MSQDNFFGRITPRRDGVEARQVERKERKEIPNRSKDFKDVLGEGDGLADDKLAAAKKLNEMSDTKRSTSLFDLAKQKSSSLKESQFVTEETASKELAEVIQDEIFEKTSSAKTKIDPEDIEGFQSDDMVNVAKNRKSKFNSEYAQHSPDISYLDPSAMGALSNTAVNAIRSDKVQQNAPVASPIHDIVTELIDKLARIETKGQTDTIVTIHKSGVFKDAIIVISEFKSANGQLNIAFENLKNEAKALLDAQPNREALMEALKDKGYTVNQMVTTTITEHKLPVAAQETQAGRSGRDQEREDDAGGNPSQKKKR